MTPSLWLSRLLALVCVLAFAVRSCSAESFNITKIGSDQGTPLYGLETSGGVVLVNTYTSQYETYLNGTLINTSSVAPDSSLMDGGTACTPTMPSGFKMAKARCNGSLLAISGWDRAGRPDASRPGLYTGLNLDQDLLLFGGDGLLFLSAAGNIAWDDSFTDAVYEATPVGSSITPEPASFLLLATGAASTLALRRRRRA